MSTGVRAMTAEELLRLPRGQFRYELVAGELTRMSPAGEEHGASIVNLAVPLAQHVKVNDLGVVFAAGTGFRLATNPDTVLAPDIAFVSRERILRTGISKGYREGAPDLAVEVTSPGDTRKEVAEKVGKWLAAGTRAVWLVNSQRRVVTVHRPSVEAVELTEADELDGGEVVPGFRCPVAEIFV